jgi:hypothetical protein
MGLPAKYSLRKLYTNELGHTVLDNLMISILKSHTDCLPGTVDEAFNKQKRFSGEEVDICGRWDADSAHIRTLLARGESRIPSSGSISSAIRPHRLFATALAECSLLRFGQKLTRLVDCS